MGHEYVDTLLTLARIIKHIIRSAYQRRALEGIVEDDDNFERAMQRDRKWKLKTSVWLLLMDIRMKSEQRPWFHQQSRQAPWNGFEWRYPFPEADVGRCPAAKW